MRKLWSALAAMLLLAGCGGTELANSSQARAASTLAAKVGNYQQFTGVFSFDVCWTTTDSCFIHREYAITGACGSFSGQGLGISSPYSIVGTYDLGAGTFTPTAVTTAGTDVWALVDGVWQTGPQPVYLLNLNFAQTGVTSYKNHGEYVSSVAQTPGVTPEQVAAAAKSCLGKPLTSPP